MNINRLQLPLVSGVVKKEGKLLLTRRFEPSLKQIHNKWEFPGGKIEFGEDPKLACEREILEETGVIVKVQELLPFPYAAVREYKDKKIQALIFCFFCEYIDTLDKFNAPKKISEIRWADIEVMDPVQIQSGTLHFIYHLIQNSFFELNKKNELNNQYIHYVSLESIDKKNNRLRAYDIVIESNIQKEVPPFKVQSLWGRIGIDYRDTDEESFNNRDKMLSYLNLKLLTRFRHNYRIVDISNDFPYVPAIEMIERSEKISHLRILN